MNLQFIDYCAPNLASINPARSLFCSHRYFGRIGFWNKYRKEFIVKNGTCWLKDLNYGFPLRNLPIVKLRFDYFANRDSFKFENVNGKIRMTIGNYVFRLPFPDGVEELLDVYQKRCYRHIKASGVVIDVGAFIGDTAIYFASQGADQVLAYEPSIMYNYAVENVELNKFKSQIELFNLAVGVKEGNIPFHFDVNHPGGSSILDRASKLYDTKTVRIIPLANIIQERGKIDLLKLDCEGSEHQIIPHLEKTGNLENIKNVMLEIHGPKQTLLQTLTRNEFRIIHVVENENGLSLVFAAKK